MLSFLGAKGCLPFLSLEEKTMSLSSSNRKRTGFETPGPVVLSSKRGSGLVISRFITKHPKTQWLKTMTIVLGLWSCGLATLSWVALLLHVVLAETERIRGLDWAGTSKITHSCRRVAGSRCWPSAGSSARREYLRSPHGLAMSLGFLTTWCLSFMKQETDTASYFKVSVRKPRMSLRPRFLWSQHQPRFKDWGDTFLLFMWQVTCVFRVGRDCWGPSLETS